MNASRDTVSKYAIPGLSVNVNGSLNTTNIVTSVPPTTKSTQNENVTTAYSGFNKEKRTTETNQSNKNNAILNDVFGGTGDAFGTVPSIASLIQPNTNKFNNSKNDHFNPPSLLPTTFGESSNLEKRNFLSEYRTDLGSKDFSYVGETF